MESFTFSRIDFFSHFCCEWCGEREICIYVYEYMWLMWPFVTVVTVFPADRHRIGADPCERLCFIFCFCCFSVALFCFWCFECAEHISNICERAIVRVETEERRPGTPYSK